MVDFLGYSFYIQFSITETLFLGAMAGFGVMIGFSNGISLAKKKDEKAFNQVK